MHMGQVVQSHGMHFFELALTFFWASMPTRQYATLSVFFKPIPNSRSKPSIYVNGGRRSSTFLAVGAFIPLAVPGGVNKALTREERETILSGYDEANFNHPTGIAIIYDWAEKNMEDINKLVFSAPVILDL